MLDGYARSGRYDLASKTWRVLCGKLRPEYLPLALETSQMLPVPPHGPDAVCYTTMIAATFRERRAYEGMNLYHALRAKQARQELHVPVETYNAVLHGLCLTNHLDKAHALLQSMGQNGVPSPSITTINVLLRAQARQKQLHAMADTLRCIAPLGLHPDVVTFTTVLDALLRTSTSPAMAQQAVQQVMQLMQSMDVQPNLDLDDQGMSPYQRRCAPAHWSRAAAAAYYVYEPESGTDGHHIRDADPRPRALLVSLGPRGLRAATVSEPAMATAVAERGTTPRAPASRDASGAALVAHDGPAAHYAHA